MFGVCEACNCMNDLSWIKHVTYHTLEYACLKYATVVDDKIDPFHRYLRYCHRSGITIFTIPSYTDTSLNNSGLFEQVLHSRPILYDVQCKLAQRWLTYAYMPTSAKTKIRLICWRWHIGLSGTSFLARWRIWMKWGIFFIHHDYIWRTIRHV